MTSAANVRLCINENHRQNVMGVGRITIYFLIKRLKAVKLNPKRFMPIHWGAYPLALHAWNEPVLQSIPMAQKLGLNPLTPLIGQVFDVDTLTPSWFQNN